MQCFSTRQQVSDAVSAAGEMTLAIFYKDADAGGGSLTVSGAYCNGNTAEIWTNSAWNDKISSMYNFCDGVTLFDNAYESGANQNYGSGYTNYVGDYMNDRTSSVEFYSIY